MIDKYFCAVRCLIRHSWFQDKSFPGMMSLHVMVIFKLIVTNDIISEVSAKMLQLTIIMSCYNCCSGVYN